MMPERLDLRYANLAAAVADEPGGDRLDDLGVGQSVDDADHRAEVDDARGVRSGWHRRAIWASSWENLPNSKLAPAQDSTLSCANLKEHNTHVASETIPNSPHTTEKISMAPAPRPPPPPLHPLVPIAQGAEKWRSTTALSPL